jgi:hypothetical protein
MNQIQKVSSYLLITFNFLLVALPLGVILLWVFIDSSAMKSLISQGMVLRPLDLPEGVLKLSQINWTFMAKLIGGFSNTIAILPLFLGLLSLKKIFQNYQNGEIFVITNARHYRHLGVLFFLDALLAKPIAGMLVVLAATVSNAPGHRYISLSFGIPNLEVLFCGIILMVISWVMLEASCLNDDQRFTI